MWRAVKSLVRDGSFWSIVVDFEGPLAVEYSAEIYYGRKVDSAMSRHLQHRK